MSGEGEGIEASRPLYTLAMLSQDPRYSLPEYYMASWRTLEDPDSLLEDPGGPWKYPGSTRMDPGGTLVVLGWTLEVPWRYTDGTLEVPWRYPDGTLVVPGGRIWPYMVFRTLYSEARSCI